MSECIQVVTNVSFQGGGPGSDCDDTIDPFNGKRFTVRMFLPMEVVTVPQRIEVVEFGSLIDIPSELQVRQAISNLCKHQSDYPDMFSYIKFPFGIIGYDGPAMLLKYHEYITFKKKVAEENTWLEQAKQNCGSLGIDIDKVYQYFRDNVWPTCARNNYHIASVRTLVGERWLTDEVIDTVFGIINKKHDDIICFLYKPTWIMHSSAGLSEKLHRMYDNSLSRVIVALNVDYDDRGTYYVSDEKRQGVHWALLVIDVKNGTSYYGDSLGWSVPSNLAI